MTGSAERYKRVRPLGHFANSSSHANSHVSGLGLGARVAAWAARRPSFQRGEVQSSTVEAEKEFDRHWRLNEGVDDLYWMWDTMRGAVLTPFMLLLYSHCFNSSFSFPGPEIRSDAAGMDVGAGRQRVLGLLFTVLTRTATRLSSLYSLPQLILVVRRKAGRNVRVVPVPGGERPAGTVQDLENPR